MFAVRMTTYDYQNNHNAILKTAVDILRFTYSLESATKKKLLNLNTHLEHIRPVSPKSIVWERISFNRKNNHYKQALRFAQLIIENCNPDVQAGKNDILAFLFDMNTLFEQYIAKQCIRASKQVENLKIGIQESKKFWENKYIQPDLVFAFDEENVVADTKWKLAQTNNPSSADLKQIYVYSIYWQARVSFLIYPSQSKPADAKPFRKPDPSEDCKHSTGILPINIFKGDELNTDIGDDIIKAIKRGLSQKETAQ